MIAQVENGRTAENSIQRLSIVRPDDWHLHLRDGEMLEAVITASAKHFARAIIMPNLVPPVVTGADAVAYRQRIQQAAAAAGHASGFEPLMTLYLTQQTIAADVIEAAAKGIIHAVKLYPAGATTNSASGVTDMQTVTPVLEAMAEHGVKLCVHGEVTDQNVDIFDREARFIDMVLDPLRQQVPGLQIVMEHVTTRQGVEYIASVDEGLAGTLTPHHLLINRNHMLVGGIRPHYYCLPILKRESHRLALVAAATSGDPRYFLGTDSAPHVRGAKQSACGCAGVFNAANTLSCLASIFEEAGALDKLEAFASLNGPRCYGLPINEGHITLIKGMKPIEPVPDLVVGDECVVGFDPGRELFWYVED